MSQFHVVWSASLESHNLCSVIAVVGEVGGRNIVGVDGVDSSIVVGVDSWDSSIVVGVNSWVSSVVVGVNSWDSGVVVGVNWSWDSRVTGDDWSSNGNGLLVDVRLGRDLDINVGLSGDLDMDVGLGSGVEVGIGHRWVIGGTIDSSIDRGGGSHSRGSGIGNWGSGGHSGGSGVGSGGGGGIAVSGVASGVGETSSVAVTSVDGDLSLGHGGTQSDNSDLQV